MILFDIFSQICIRLHTSLCPKANRQLSYFTTLNHCSPLLPCDKDNLPRPISFEPLDSNFLTEVPKFHRFPTSIFWTFCSTMAYRAVILNWQFLRLNLGQVLLLSKEISPDMAQIHIYIWLTMKMMDLLIVKLMLSFLDCMRNLPIIIYTKPPI